MNLHKHHWASKKKNPSFVSLLIRVHDHEKCLLLSAKLNALVCSSKRCLCKIEATGYYIHLLSIVIFKYFLGMNGNVLLILAVAALFRPCLCQSKKDSKHVLYTSYLQWLVIITTVLTCWQICPSTSKLLLDLVPPDHDTMPIHTLLVKSCPADRKKLGHEQVFFF